MLKWTIKQKCKDKTEGQWRAGAYSDHCPQLSLLEEYGSTLKYITFAMLGPLENFLEIF